MLGVLTALLPVDLTIAGVAAAIGRLRPGPPIERAAHPRTVLLTGGKMTKSLTLARAFGRAGHRVVLVETAKYRWCGHRFSNCVDAFHVVPDPDDPGYPDAIATVVATEGVDVFVPVCSPLASRYDALAAARLPDHVEVIHAAHDVIGILDDKDRFAASAAELGLRVPETHRITSVADVLGFDFAARPDRRYLLKSIPYDPVHRADLTTLPLATSELTADHVRSLPISDERPWILQEFVDGDEYCTHGTVRSGVTTVSRMTKPLPGRKATAMAAKANMATATTSRPVMIRFASIGVRQRTLPSRISSAPAGRAVMTNPSPSPFLSGPSAPAPPPPAPRTVAAGTTARVARWSGSGGRQASWGPRSRPTGEARTTSRTGPRSPQHDS
jgi:hypothetical protein